MSVGRFLNIAMVWIALRIVEAIALIASLQLVTLLAEVNDLDIMRLAREFDYERLRWDVFNVVGLYGLGFLYYPFSILGFLFIDGIKGLSPKNTKIVNTLIYLLHSTPVVLLSSYMTKNDDTVLKLLGLNPLFFVWLTAIIVNAISANYLFVREREGK